MAMHDTRRAGARRLVAALVVSTGLGACGDDPPVADERPFREGWTPEATIPFVHTGDDGELLIAKVSIGGPAGPDNFANRGDVVVLFDAEPDTMRVELRRFTMASTDPSAQEQLGLLGLWAYEGSLLLPEHKAAEDGCLDGWRSECQLRVFADALSQREVSGADLRVHLPPDYRGVVQVQTEDDSALSDYLNRGDVCIDGLPGSAEVQLHSGRAWVRVADEVTPTPTCPAADVAACEAFTMPDAEGRPVPVPWAPECPCLAEGHGYGRVTVDSRNQDVTDITVDVPPGLWGALSLQNRLHQALVRDCTATVTLPGEALELDPPDNEAEADGLMNFPGVPALRGGGYRLTLESGTCGPVAFAEGPEDFAAAGDEPPVERRGDLEVCSGCIERGCDALVP